MATIVDSYSESNYDSEIYDYRAYGQSFTGDGGVLNSAKFYLKKYGSPTGTVFAAIYAHTGTFGTNSKPMGVPLAVSDNVNVSTLSTSFGLVSFTFSGANKITLTAGTKYVVVFDCINSSNTISVGMDSSSPSHSGNVSDRDGEDWYTDYSGYDLCFYVYKDDKVGPFPTHLQV
jgi:hypothetical protein